MVTWEISWQLSWFKEFWIIDFQSNVYLIYHSDIHVTPPLQAQDRHPALPWRACLLLWRRCGRTPSQWGVPRRLRPGRNQGCFLWERFFRIPFLDVSLILVLTLAAKATSSVDIISPLSNLLAVKDEIEVENVGGRGHQQLKAGR